MCLLLFPVLVGDILDVHATIESCFAVLVRVDDLFFEDKGVS